MISRPFHHLTILIASAGPVLSTLVPPGSQQGTYIVTLTPEGEELHTRVSGIPDIHAVEDKLSPFSQATPPLTPHLPRRDATSWPSDTKPLCSDSPWITTAAFNSNPNGARNAFAAQCAALNGKRLGYREKIYSHWGEAVAYMCSYAGSGDVGNGRDGGNPCVVQEWVDAVEWAARACGGRNGDGYMECGRVKVYERADFGNGTAYLTIPGWKKAYGYTHINTSFC
ncbi:hypothetical protein CPAR01_15271 [Colletotrichum paranaense]|uniref:Secreted protein n=1 Tax=Colletotrichum paranaense TaxID=1914294 RepID=A0ABQ9RZW9_9PEZI|nr:uncharacterized protein CPAR01_15271 [Colletotrichum paranaense]KAK1520220.1 hypothetical protein CPAR01_15271 [Colletotrichum paranaense]